MIVVTGGCGMIGSNLILALNALDRRDILVADNMTHGAKTRNLCRARIEDYIDKSELSAALRAMRDVEAVFHLGACSSTTEADGRYVMDNNYRYSSNLLAICNEKKIPLYYASSASVYGNSSLFREEPECEQPLSPYAFSKWLFDEKVRRLLAQGVSAPLAGLRFFNVYGPGEHHKTGMHSPMFRSFVKISRGEPIQLFGPQFEGAEEPRRDFVYVSDAVAVLIWAWQTRQNGIYNVGTGEAFSFGEIALLLAEVMGRGRIETIAFPSQMAATYQRRTQACLNRIRNAGYGGTFRSVRQGISDYCAWLEVEAPHLHGPISAW